VGDAPTLSLAELLSHGHEDLGRYVWTKPSSTDTKLKNVLFKQKLSGGQNPYIWSKTILILSAGVNWTHNTLQSA